MRTIEKIGESGLVVSTVLVFESEEERNEYFRNLRREEEMRYSMSVYQEQAWYRERIMEIQTEQKKSKLEIDIQKGE